MKELTTAVGPILLVLLAHACGAHCAESAGAPAYAGFATKDLQFPAGLLGPLTTLQVPQLPAAAAGTNCGQPEHVLPTSVDLSTYASEVRTCASAADKPRRVDAREGRRLVARGGTEGHECAKGRALLKHVTARQFVHHRRSPFVKAMYGSTYN